MTDALRSSRHLSWFHQRGALFLHHDLFGYLLEMSPDLGDVVRAFDTPRSIERALKSLKALPKSLVLDAIEILCEQDCLVPADLDELTLLCDRFPIHAHWIVVDKNHAPWTAYLSRHISTPVRTLTFDEIDERLWDLIDGNRSTARIHRDLEAQGYSLSLEELYTRLARWTHSEVGLLKVMTAPKRFFEKTTLPAYVKSTMPFARLEDECAFSHSEMRIDLRSYHHDVISDAGQQFDEIETTLSHLFRDPHPALNGKSYAGALLDALVQRGLSLDVESHIEEVGGGVGWFARRFLGELSARGLPSPRYKIIDLSPALQESQRSLTEHLGVDQLLANGEDLPGPSETLDLLLCNEVIADFRSDRIEVEQSQGSEGWEDPEAMLDALEEDPPPPQLSGAPEALSRIERYGLLPDAPPACFLFNTGAILFLERLWTRLKPGGMAFVSEFGDRWKLPVESTHLDHAEVSIQFGHLERCAKALGFEVELLDVVDLLSLDESQSSLMTTQSYFRCLRALFQAHGKALEKRSFTQEMLRERCGDRLSLEAIDALYWTTLQERTMGLVPREFKALILKKGQKC